MRVLVRLSAAVAAQNCQRGRAMKRFFYLTILLFIVVTLSTFAQSPSTGAQMSGTILDPNGAVVPGAAVTLRSETTGIEQATTSDASGQYGFLLVPAGRY